MINIRAYLHYCETLSTRGALTVSVSDMVIPEKKGEYLAEAEKAVDKVTKLFKRGLMTDEERYNKVIEAWNSANDKITKALLSGLCRTAGLWTEAKKVACPSCSALRVFLM